MAALLTIITLHPPLVRSVADTARFRAFVADAMTFERGTRPVRPLTYLGRSGVGSHVEQWLESLGYREMEGRGLVHASGGVYWQRWKERS